MSHNLFLTFYVGVNVDLVGLTNDFIHTVTLYGKIIVRNILFDTRQLLS